MDGKSIGNLYVLHKKRTFMLTTTLNLLYVVHQHCNYTKLYIMHRNLFRAREICTMLHVTMLCRVRLDKCLNVLIQRCRMSQANRHRKSSTCFEAYLKMLCFMSRLLKGVDKGLTCRLTMSTRLLTKPTPHSSIVMLQFLGAHRTTVRLQRHLLIYGFSFIHVRITLDVACTTRCG